MRRSFNSSVGYYPICHLTTSEIRFYVTMHRFSWLVAVAAVLIILSGCRSYGGRYDAEEATYRQIAPAIEDLSAELQRVQARPDADQIFEDGQSALRTESFTTPFNVLVDEYRERYEEMSPSSSYRDLSRLYRAIITDYHTLRVARQRAELATAADEVTAPTDVVAPSPYNVRPVFYHRLERSSARRGATDAMRSATDAADNAVTDTAGVDAAEGEPDQADAIGD